MHARMLTGRLSADLDRGPGRGRVLACLSGLARAARPEYGLDTKGDSIGDGTVFVRRRPRFEGVAGERRALEGGDPREEFLTEADVFRHERQTFLDRRDRIETPGHIEESVHAKLVPVSAQDHRRIRDPPHVRHPSPAHAVDQRVEELVLGTKTPGFGRSDTEGHGFGPEGLVIAIAAGAREDVPVQIERGLMTPGR